MAEAARIDSQIIGYLERLTIDKKKLVLTVMKSFASEKDTLWDMMPVEVKKRLEKSLGQSKKGQVRSHDEVMKKYSKWLGE